MIKSGKSPPDAAQQKLRQNKATLNKETSEFINDLIHFKKMMNGWPSKFFKEKSLITNPIPADPATIIGSLAGDFQDIVNKNNSIIQEQINYSKTRRQKQIKSPTPNVSTPTSPDLSQQLSKGLTASNSYEGYLISEASNPLSRFFARLLNPAIGSSEKARIRKYRMSLLTASVNLYKDLGKLQVSVVGSGPQSIFTASKLLDKVEDNWSFLVSGFQTFKDTLPQGVLDSGGDITLPNIPNSSQVLETNNIDSILAEATFAIQDLKSNINNFVTGIPKSIQQLIMNFELASPIEKKQLAPEIVNVYKKLLVKLSSDNKLLGTAISLNEILSQMNKTPSVDKVAQLEVLAQNFINKWVGKTKHQLSPFDKTSALRLDIYNSASDTRKLINKIMNSLENDMQPIVLAPLMNQVGSNIMKIRTIMRGLTSTIRGNGYQPKFMNMLENKNLNDYGVDLDIKQKEHLDKMLKHRQLRDLTQMYSRK